MIHKTDIDQYPHGLANLAKDLGDLRYDALADFLEALSAKIKEDAAKDDGRGRIQLAAQLNGCAEQLAKAANSIDKAWKICEPYM